MTLFRYILRQVALGVVVAVVGMFFIAIPGIAVSAVHRIGGGGMSTLLGFIPMVVVDLLPYLLPIGFLLAVVSTYGRLSAESEWTAIRMAGIHPLKSAAPALVVALACSGVLHVLVSEVSPTLTYVERVYLRNAVVKSFRSLSPGRTEISVGEFYLNAPDRDGNTFFDALIHIPASKGKEARTVLADSVTIEALETSIRIQMVNCRTVYGQGDTLIGRPTIEIDLDEIFDTGRNSKRSWRWQSTSDLRKAIADGQIPAKDREYAHYEVQARYALALTPMLFLLLGVPTGLLLRSGTQLAALAVAVAYALVYYLLQMRLSKSIGQHGAMPYWVAAWGVTAIGAATGLWLSVKAFRK